MIDLSIYSTPYSTRTTIILVKIAENYSLVSDLDTYLLVAHHNGCLDRPSHMPAGSMVRMWGASKSLGAYAGDPSVALCDPA